jgi:hypothetical protein
VGVLLKIQINGTKNYFILDQPDYHAFPSEKEVLLQDGLKYEILSINLI